MNITAANAGMDGIYPVLNLEIDGHPAYVFEPKLTLLKAGVVVLLDTSRYWEETISTWYGSGRERQELRGATRDRQLVALVRRFVAGESGDLLSPKECLK